MRTLALQCCEVDVERGVVHGAAGEVTLTHRERTLLDYLAARPSVDVARDELLTRVWGYGDQVLSRAVDCTVRRLRDKIEANPERPHHLLTVHGLGYRFVPRREEVEPLRATPPSWCVVLGDRVVDLEVGAASGPNGRVPFTALERAMLRLLAEQAGRIVEHTTILRTIWPERRANGRLLAGVMHRLRAKIEPDPAEPRFLLTVRGTGYRLVLAPEPPAREALTLVQVGIWQEREAWEHDPARMAVRTTRLLERLDRTSRAGSGLPTGDPWRHVFSDLATAIRWATALQREPGEEGLGLLVAVGGGNPTIWRHPLTGCASCVGPAVQQVQALLDVARPGVVMVDAALALEVA